MDIYQYFLDNPGRPIHKSANQFAVFERHLARRRGQHALVVEVGAGQGGSAQMWQRYFGPLARIVSIDHDPACKTFEGEQVKVRIGDQADRAFLAAVIDEFGEPDVVLDDGSHAMSDVAATFETLYPRCARDGCYLIEAAQTSYWTEYGGGLRQPGTTVERTKAAIGHVSDGAWPGTASIHVYDGMIVFERGRQALVTP